MPSRPACLLAAVVVILMATAVAASSDNLGAPTAVTVAIDCTRLTHVRSSATAACPSSPRSLERKGESGEVWWRMSARLATEDDITGGSSDVVHAYGRCGGEGEGLLRVEYSADPALLHKSAQGVGLIVDISLDGKDGEDRSSVWIDISGQEGGIMEFQMAHMPRNQQRKDGQMPDCYSILTFQARIGPAPLADQDTVAAEGQQSRIEKRHFFPQPVECDNRDDVVIGLAVGLGVAGGLFVCSVLLCSGIAIFQQYRMRNGVGGGGGGQDYGGQQQFKDYGNDEGLDFSGGGKGARGAGGADRSRAATAARSMGRHDIEVNVPELGQASPRAGRQVNKTNDAMSHLREVDEVEMQSVNSGTAIPAPLW